MPALRSTTRWLAALAAGIASLAAADRAAAAAPLVDPQRAAVAASFGLASECIEGRASTVDPSYVLVNTSYAEGCGDTAVFLGSVLRSEDGGQTYRRVIDLPEQTTCPVEGVPTAVALDLAVCSDPATQRPVLGEYGYAGEYGDGWGLVKPRKIDNGGVPSGVVRSIRWRRWGSRVATGRGVTSLYKPGGGYYRRSGRIRLRASRLGVCPGTGGTRAYRRLTARVQRKPGGRYGRWFAWGGDGGICGTFPRRALAGAARTVVVPHQDPRTSPVYRVRPRTLSFGALHATADAEVSARRIRWRRWGGRTAVGRGTIRVGDPDNGYISRRGTIRLSRVSHDGCGDEPVRPMYHRARVTGVRRALNVRSVVFEPLLIC